MRTVVLSSFVCLFLSFLCRSYITARYLPCSRLRDGGGKSFSNKKCEKLAGAGECAHLIFALLVLIRSTILSESLVQATRY